MPEVISGTDSANGVSLAQSIGTTNAGLITQTPDTAADVEQEKFFNYASSLVHLKRLIDDWHTEVEDSEVRRKTRDVEIDVEGLRQKGDLDEDETIVQVRVIDTNITREQPPYINYIKNSRRLCTFRCIDNPSVDPQQIELEFTRGATYANWETPHFKCLDGAQTHGWDAKEVVYDEDKPLHFALEHIGHDCLFFPRSVKDFQQASRVIRAYDVTILKLKEWVRSFGFDLEQVNRLIQTRKDTQKEGETVRIYKLFFKKDGAVYVSWFAMTNGVSDWLKAPMKLYLGIRQQDQMKQWSDSDITQYPIFVLPYRESEKPKVVDHKGRVFYDEPKQEAQTAILSGFINGCTRASNIFSSPAQEDGTGSSLKELEDVKLCGGRILSKPMQFWSPPYPDPMIIRAMQWFKDDNAEESNQFSFATLNREDSRKTAKEVSAAENQQSQINSVQLTLFSTDIRSVYSFVWLIVQSQALQSKIPFLLIEKKRPMQSPFIPGQQMMDPATQQPMMETYYENDFRVIGGKWDVRAAGDVDVVERQQKIGQMKQDWPVVANTPLALRFLADLMKLEYPDSGEQYATIIMQGDTQKQLISQMGTIITAMIKDAPQVIQSLQPQEQQMIQQVLQQAAQLSAPEQKPQKGGQ